MIAFDVDGVLANFVRGFTRIGYRLFGTPVCDTTKYWIFEDMIAMELDKLKCEQIWNEIHKSPKFWCDLDPCNVSVMRIINNIVNRVFITNRLGIEPGMQTALFLDQWGIDQPRVIVAAEKGSVASKEQITAFIDDNYLNCLDVMERCPNAYVALLTSPHNEEVQLNIKGLALAFGITVVLSVDHFINECERRKLIVWS